MRLCIRLLYFLTIVLLIPLCASADFQKSKIAVLDFQLQGEEFENKDMGTIVAEWFTTAMVREGRFDVIERRMLQKVLGEQKLAMAGIVDASSATQIGKLLGVKVIITGSVMKFRDTFEINARIIDVESASIIAAENLKCTASSGLQRMVVEMSGKITKNFPLEGYVVNRNKDSVTLDLGIRTGVKEDMQFIVFKEGQVIKHPKTGEVLDVEKIQTGIVTITIVRHKICEAIIDKETTPGSIQYGQQVKSIVDTRPKDGRLFVDVSPANARIRILNITPAYKRGMILDPGSYNIEISAPGYRNKSEWITLEKGEQKTISFELSADNSDDKSTRNNRIETPASYSPPAMEKSPSSLTPDQKKYIPMLQSNSSRNQRNAAKLIVRQRITDPAVLDEVEKALLKGYQQNSSDRHHIDSMAWLCKALGASGAQKYRSTLNRVKNKSTNRKLKSYAEQSLNKLR